MKREDLIKAGITDDNLINAIMALHGQDIEGHKTKLTTATTELEGLKKQLEDANGTIASFNGMDIEGIKKTAEDYKAKFEQAQKDAAAQIAQIRFDTALDRELTGAKARDLKAVRVNLNLEGLKLEEDGTIKGLKEQLEKLQTEKDFLFDKDGKTPRIILNGTPASNGGGDTFASAIQERLNKQKES